MQQMTENSHSRELHTDPRRNRLGRILKINQFPFTLDTIGIRDHQIDHLLHTDEAATAHTIKENGNFLTHTVNVVVDVT